MYFAITALIALTAVEIVHIVYIGSFSSEIFSAITGLIGTIVGVLITSKGWAYLDPNRKTMGKQRVFLRFQIRKLRAKFDGETQAVRGALIAELEVLYRKVLAKVGAVHNEKNKIHWSRVAAYIAKTINLIAREYDSNKILERLQALEEKVGELREKDRGSGEGSQKARKRKKKKNS